MENFDLAYDDIVTRMNGVDNLELRVDEIPPPAPIYTTDKLLIKKSQHFWGGFRLDTLVFIAERHLFRRLALLLAAALIHDQKRDPLIRIDLTNSECDVRAIFIDARRLKTFRLEIFQGARILETFWWSYREPTRHPWSGGSLPDNLYHLPYFDLTDQSDGEGFAVNYDARDFAIIGGCLESFDQLINFLLNMSDERTLETEFVLESEPGFRGVAPASAQAAFGLPGSIWWDCYGRHLED